MGESGLLERWTIGEVSLAVDIVDTGEAAVGSDTTPGVRSAGPVLFIHGSWDDHHTWDATRRALATPCRQVAYDRRGHSASTDVVGQGTIRQDVADAAGIITELGVGPAQVVGHSYGACIAILLATTHPELVAGLVLHEPPLFALLAADHPELLSDATSAMGAAVELAAAGQVEAAAIQFIDNVAFGPGSWANLFGPHDRAAMLANIDTWLDQSRDPDRLAVDAGALADFAGPVTLTTGTDSLAAFGAVTRIVRSLVPASRLVTIDGAGHGAPVSHPDALAAAIDQHLTDQHLTGQERDPRHGRARRTAEVDDAATR